MKPPPTHWERAKELFEACEGLEQQARASFLVQACAGEEGLRREVESLLRAYAHAPRFFESPLPDRFPEILALEERGLAPGRVVGGFRLVERIASGGTASVWRAQSVAAPGTEVAIKVLQDSVPGGPLLRSFAAERESLANLSHPYIARLLGAGLLEDGRPYLVMELIEGIPIDLYCQRQALDLKARLRLFQRVCEAVFFAHRRLVVHSDLKPDNILVTAAGEPRLLDFGISRLLPAGSTVESGPCPGWQALTPDYASPEQLRGEPLTTATDIYSLGVILHELLTGLKPGAAAGPKRHGLAGGGPHEPLLPSQLVLQHAQAATARREEPGPEAATAHACGMRPEALAQALRGDLDGILRKALHEDPAERYVCPRSFAEDIDRFLAGRPVQALAASRSYHALRWLRRHRRPLLAGCVALALLAAFAWQQEVSMRHAAEARGEQRVLHQMTHFVVDLFRSTDPRHGGGAIQDPVDLLNLAANMLQAEGQLAEEPLIRASLLAAIGSSLAFRQELDLAESLLEQSLDLRLETHGEEHPEVAEALHLLGDLRRLQGRYAEAEILLRRALTTWRRDVGDDELEVAHVALDLGIVLQALGQQAEAALLYQEALRIRRLAVGEDHPWTREAASRLEQVVLGEGQQQVGVDQSNPVVPRAALVE